MSIAFCYHCDRELYLDSHSDGVCPVCCSPLIETEEVIKARTDSGPPQKTASDDPEREATHP